MPRTKDSITNLSNRLRSSRSRYRYVSGEGFSFLELMVVLVILVALAGLVIPIVSNTTANTGESVTEANMVRVRDAFIRYWTDTKYELLPGPLATSGATAASDTDTSLVGNTSNRFQIRWLFENPANDPSNASDDTLVTYDPSSRLGWNGPYLLQPTGQYEVDDADGLQASGSNFSALYGNAGDPAIVSSTLNQGEVPRPLVIQAVFVDDNSDSSIDRIDCRIVSAGLNRRIDIPNDQETNDLDTDDIVDDSFLAFTLRP